MPCICVCEPSGVDWCTGDNMNSKISLTIWRRAKQALSKRSYIHTWGVQVLRYPNFFSREWKQIETWKLLEETWPFFRLGEVKWQHCTTRWMLVRRSSCSSVFDTEMATFTFEEQSVITRFLHLRGMKPIEIHRQLSETCSDGVMDVKNVRSWVRQFEEDRTSCDVGRSSSKVS